MDLLPGRPFHPITALRSNGQEKMKGKKANPSGREALSARYSSRALDMVCSPSRCQGRFRELELEFY